MIDCKYRKQADKARGIQEKLENTEIKSKIYYLSHIFTTVNMLNFKLQSKKIRLGYLCSADKRLHEETEILKKRTVDIRKFL